LAEVTEFLEELQEEIVALGGAEERLRAWVAAVVTGDLSLNEFKGLVEGETVLLEMTALQQKVSAKVMANAVKNMVLEKALEVVTEFVGRETE